MKCHRDTDEVRTRDCSLIPIFLILKQTSIKKNIHFCVSNFEPYSNSESYSQHVHFFLALFTFSCPDWVLLNGCCLLYLWHPTKSLKRQDIQLGKLPLMVNDLVYV